MTAPALNLAARPAAIARGIGFMVLAVFLFAVMDASIKWLSPRYDSWQIVFARGVFALIPLSIMVARAGGPAVLRTRHVKAHVVRALVGIVSLWCVFYALGVMPLADAYAIFFAAPLFCTALSVPMLGERVGPRRWAAVAVGFLGVLVMVKPSGDVLSQGALLCLIGTVLYALAVMMVRRMASTESNEAIVMTFTLTTIFVGGIAMLPNWTTPSLADLPVFIAVGFFGGFAQWCITEAFRSAPIAIVAPFEYTAMLWGVLFGWAVWGELPGANIWFGAVLVIASGLYILHRETRRKAEAPPKT